MKLVTHIPLMSTLGISAALPTFPHMPSWYAQGQIYLLLLVMVVMSLRSKATADSLLYRVFSLKWNQLMECAL